MCVCVCACAVLVLASFPGHTPVGVTWERGYTSTGSSVLLPWTKNLFPIFCFLIEVSLYPSLPCPDFICSCEEGKI